MCNVHLEDQIVTTSKFIVYVELKFSCVKRDVKKWFDWNVLRNVNNLNNCFPEHNIVYVTGPYQA